MSAAGNKAFSILRGGGSASDSSGVASMIAAAGGDPTARTASGYRVWIEGDSIDAYACDTDTGNSIYYRDRSWFTALNILMGQRFYFRPNMMTAVPGQGTAEIRARYPTSIAANYAKFDVLALGGGTNDGGKGLTKEQTRDNKIWMAEQALTAGKDVWMILIPPRKSTSFQSIDPVVGRNRAMWVNEQLKAWARSRDPRTFKGRLIVLDPWNAAIDPQSATANPYDLAGTELTLDGLHWTNYGANVLAAAYKAVLDPYYPPINSRIASIADVYNATDNPSGNLLGTKGYFSGTTANGGGVYTGTSAAGWGPIKPGSSTFTASELTVAKETVAGYAGSRLNMTLNPSGKANQEVAYVAATVLPSDGYASGDTVEAFVGVEVSGLSNCYGIEALISDDDGRGSSQSITAVANRYTSVNYFLQYPNSTILLLRTPPLTIRPYSGSGTQRLQMFLQLSVNAVTSASVTAKWFEPAIRKVTA